MESFVGNIGATGIALAALVGVVSGLLQGYTGFGGGLLIVPLLALLFGPVEGILVAAFAGVVAQIQLVPSAARNADWSDVWPLLIGVLVALPVGTAFLVSADPEVARRAIGGFVLVSALVMMSGWVYRGPRGILASAATGALAGAVTGVTGTPSGPFLVLYYLAAPVSPEVQRANIVIAVGVMVSILLISLVAGAGVSNQTLVLCAVVAPVHLAGAWGGARLFRVMPKTWFRRVALWLLVATGVTVLVL